MISRRRFFHLVGLVSAFGLVSGLKCWGQHGVAQKLHASLEPELWEHLTTATALEDVRHMQDVIDDICQNWGGDSNNLFLSGFSRGAIACGYIGLANDEIAKLWKGFIACQHYDGFAWNQSNVGGAIERAPRFQGEAIFQVDNSNQSANYEQLMEYTDPAVEWTWVSSGLGHHSTAMFLDDRAMMIQLRQWFRDLTAE